MNDLNIFIDLFPSNTSKAVLIALLVLVLTWRHIPILREIRIRFDLSENFMRNFRWLTPLMGFLALVVGVLNLIMLFHIYRLLIQLLKG